MPVLHTGPRSSPARQQLPASRRRPTARDAAHPDGIGVDVGTLLQQIHRPHSRPHSTPPECTPAEPLELPVRVVAVMAAVELLVLDGVQDDGDESSWAKRRDRADSGPSGRASAHTYTTPGARPSRGSGMRGCYADSAGPRSRASPLGSPRAGAPGHLDVEGRTVLQRLEVQDAHHPCSAATAPASGHTTPPPWPAGPAQSRRDPLRLLTKYSRIWFMPALLGRCQTCPPRALGPAVSMASCSGLSALLDGVGFLILSPTAPSLRAQSALG